MLWQAPQAIAAPCRLGDGAESGKRAAVHGEIHVHIGLDKLGTDHARPYSGLEASLDVLNDLRAVRAAPVRR